MQSYALSLEAMHYRDPPALPGVCVLESLLDLEIGIVIRQAVMVGLALQPEARKYLYGIKRKDGMASICGSFYRIDGLHAELMDAPVGILLQAVRGGKSEGCNIVLPAPDIKKAGPPFQRTRFSSATTFCPGLGEASLSFAGAER